MSAARIALVTAAEAVGLDEDAGLLLSALADAGAHAELVVWDDEAADWGAWDLAVLRSTWDYPRRPAAFLRWAERAAAVTALVNDLAVITWNTDKRYLLEVADRGVPIVPSTIVASGETPDLPADDAFVVKPAVSVGAQDTARYAPAEHEAARAHVARLHAARRDVLVQPYIAQVDARGETAMIFLEGAFSHAVRKASILAADTQTVGGLFAAEQIDVRVPSDDERAAAERAIGALPFARAELLYARVDLVPAPDGTPLVLEIELVEPSLFLRYAPGAAARFASAITARL